MVVWDGQGGVHMYLEDNTLAMVHILLVYNVLDYTHDYNEGQAALVCNK